MSGGQWDYCQFRIGDFLEEISQDPQVKKRWPKLAKVFIGLKEVLPKIIYDMDWDLSGDTEIQDDTKFQKEAIKSLSKLFKGLSLSNNSPSNYLDDLLSQKAEVERMLSETAKEEEITQLSLTSRLKVLEYQIDEQLAKPV